MSRINRLSEVTEKGLSETDGDQAGTSEGETDGARLAPMRKPAADLR